MPETFDIQDVDAERAAIGCMLRRHDALLAGIDGMNAKDFAHEGNKRIYQTIQHMHERGQGVDKLTLVSTLRLAGKLDNVGGELAIEKCVQGVPSLTNYKDYMATVRDRAQRRHIIDVADHIVRSARSEPSVDVLLGMVERQVSALRNGLQGAGHKGMSSEDLANAYVSRLVGGEDTHDRFPYPLPSLNQATLGMRRGQVIVAAARPSDGKSLLFGTQLMLSGLRRKPTANYGMFSLEMSVEEVYGRMLIDEGVNLDAFKTNKATAEDHVRLDAAVEQLRSYKLSLYGGNRPINEIVALQRQAGHDVVIIDHLQHMVGNEWGMIPGIMVAASDMATDTNCVVVVLSQLTRPMGEFKQKNLRPVMSELKGSSAIEEVADAIWFVWREWQGSEQKPDGEVIQGKLRGGSRISASRIPIKLDANGRLRFVEMEVVGAAETAQPVPDTGNEEPGGLGCDIQQSTAPIPGLDAPY